MNFYYLPIILATLLIQFAFTQNQQLIKVNLDSIEIGIAEKDQTTIKYESINYPTGLNKLLELDGNQKLSIKFCVRDQLKSQDITVQQASIMIKNMRTNKEVIYIADQDRISKVYNKDINLAYRGKDFNYQSGDYSIGLVIGDPSIQESIYWTLGKANIQFSQEPISESSWLDRYQAKPEIAHQFRQPEKRPPVIVSNTFTFLSLSPLLVLIYCWSKVGLNSSKFKFSISALVFHGSLILIFTLYTLFFIHLDMFTTIKCLSGVLVSCFLSGYYLLKNLSSK